MHDAMKTLLAATDLSRPAFAAVRRAALIARAHDAKLELIHVIPHSLTSATWNELRAAFVEIEADLRGAAQENLEELVVQIETECGVKAHAFVVEGKPFAEIAARSETIDADLVVVGAHGENVVLTPWLGTTAHRVLRVSRKPVLLVKRTPPVEASAMPGYEHVVLATDFSDDAAQAASSTRRLFPQSNITLFHAYQSPFEAKLAGRVPESTVEKYRQLAFDEAHRELEAFANAVGLSEAPRAVRHGPPGLRIREYAADTSADLIAVGSEEVPRLQNALLGSVSLDVVTQADCDVLLARAPAV